MSEECASSPCEASHNETSAASSIPGATLCYFMVVDILGFSEIIKNLKGDELDQRIMDWIELVQTTKVEAGVKETQLLSDTLFVREEDSADGLERLLTFARLMLERGFDKNFPLRGSIVHGNAAWGTLTYGDAVRKAHEYERSFEWVGIACEPGLPRIDEMWDWDVVVVYPVPRKTGEVQTMPAVAWNVPDTNKLVHGAAANGLMSDKEVVRWETATKWERTIRFGLYLRVGKLGDLNPRVWTGGWLPMHFIEKLLGKPLKVPE